MSRKVPAFQLWLISLGERSPRLLGLVQFGLGALICGMNIAMLVSIQRYYGALFIVGFPLLAIGTWTFITGVTTTHGAAVKPPLWWMIGMYACSGIGILGGIYVSIHLGK